MKNSKEIVMPKKVQRVMGNFDNKLRDIMSMIECGKDVPSRFALLSIADLAKLQKLVLLGNIGYEDYIETAIFIGDCNIGLLEVIPVTIIDWLNRIYNKYVVLKGAVKEDET